ncbi:DUF805 domain-containing protein [Pseudonocardia spinosispora]|uniref:DUF805 domain-containing protein n=1 Tax=Pseudonocardia spinosispora TaxID=103441 RepID=UPI000412398E|nr:DUF805 domain-containing protein [Pseudonocardia spinosispora]
MKWYLKAMRQYADFSGRSRRTEFWMYALFNIIIVAGLLVLGGVSGGMSDSPSPVGNVLLGVLVCYYLGAILPTWAVTARRLHDTNKSGWLQLIGLIPFGGLVVIIFCATEGDRGPNRYGPDPKVEYAPLS